MNINKYLSIIQSTESVGSFAIDSFPGKKKKKKKNIVYQLTLETDLQKSKRVLIDLDRTIHRYSKGWQDGQLYDIPWPEAKEAIDLLKNEGYEIVIFTTRVCPENLAEKGQDLDEQMINIENWLKNYDIYFDRITAQKLSADFYIDDKAITIKDGDWNNVLEQINKRKK